MGRRTLEPPRVFRSGRGRRRQECSFQSMRSLGAVLRDLTPWELLGLWAYLSRPAGNVSMVVPVCSCGDGELCARNLLSTAWLISEACNP